MHSSPEASEKQGKRLGADPCIRNEGLPIEPIILESEDEKEGIKASSTRAREVAALSKLAFGVALRKQPRVPPKSTVLPPIEVKSKSRGVKKRRKHDCKASSELCPEKSHSCSNDSCKKENQNGTNGSWKPNDECNLHYPIPDELKLKLSMEIKQQVLGGLGMLDKDVLQNVQVDVEGLSPMRCTEGVMMNSREHSGVQHFMANVKFMAMVCIPVTIDATQEALGNRKQEGVQDVRVETDEPFNGLYEEQNPSLAGEEESLGKDKLTSQSHCEDERVVMNSMFYDFDSNRVGGKFSENQVWAMYDKPDGMPRFYVKVNKVISLNPFKVLVSALLPDVPLPIYNGEGKYSLSCGIFRAGRPCVCEHVNSFSHIMRSKSVEGGKVAIYPEAGEVWALYKNWEEVDFLKRIESGFEIIRVLVVDKGTKMLTVVSLVKYGSFDTIFRNQKGKMPTEISMEDVVQRFSHRILVYELVGSCESLQGYLELDPASTPF